jgi:hypothetical protein
MDIPVVSLQTQARAAQCPACGSADAMPHHFVRDNRSYRGAWFVLGCAFVLGLFWANRYDYQMCDVDGCVRINRWTSSVDWVASGIPTERDVPYSVRL